LRKSLLLIVGVLVEPGLCTVTMLPVWSSHQWGWLKFWFPQGDAVVNVYINQEKRFAFVEMRTVEEASNAMALDGIVYEVLASLLGAS
jgi:hypothetical protein